MQDAQAIISLQIPEGLDSWLQGVAKKRMTSKSAVAREFLAMAKRAQEKETQNEYARPPRRNR